MFQFPGFPSIRYGLAYGYWRSSPVGFPIQRSADRWIFAPPRSFSQLITSFFGSQCQGIHPALFFAWPSTSIALDASGSLCLLLVLSLIVLHNLRCLPISSCSFIKRIKIFLDYICSFQGTFFFWLYQPDENKNCFYPQLTGKTFSIYKPLRDCFCM